jgi:hypothetical protein
MAIQNVFDINVDLKQPTVIKTPIITKSDTVVFNIHVYDDGKVFDVSSAEQFSIFSKRPDGQVIGKSGTVSGQNTIQFPLGTSETSVPGIVSATIQIYDANGRVSTFPFYYQVLDDPSVNYVQSSTEVTLLQSLINSAQTAVDNANAAVNSASTAATNANNAASSANAAATNANNAATAANNAATNANNAATNANNAATNANTQAALINNLQPLGNYNPDTTYVKNNIVLYNGSSYIAKQTTRGHTPVGDQNDPYWALLAQKGIDGMGTVSKVNNKSPDGSGNVTLNASDVGAISQTLTTVSGVSLNTLTTTGLYYADSTCTDLPAAGKDYMVMQIVYDSSHLSQIAIDTSTADLYTRSYNGSSWTTWISQEQNSKNYTDQMKIIIRCGGLLY